MFKISYKFLFIAALITAFGAAAAFAQDKTDDPVRPHSVACDEFSFTSPDDAKARFDNCLMVLHNNPGSMLHLIIYPGNARNSTRYEKVVKITLQYLINARGIYPQKIQIARGPARARTTYGIYIVPPGAEPPVPR